MNSGTITKSVLQDINSCIKGCYEYLGEKKKPCKMMISSTELT